MQSISVKIHNSSKDAPNYSQINEDQSSHVYKNATIKEAHIVMGGMQSGKSTIDLVFEDDHGQKYVCLISTEILRSIIHIEGAKSR